jgi:trehalose 6-phosphate phosphatase
MNEITPLFSAAGQSALVSVMQRKPLLAFDFDGTLAPIVEHPDDARVPAPWAPVLKELASLVPVAIVTGRSVADVTARLPFEPRYILGNHGAEDPAGALPTGSIDRLNEVRRKLSRNKGVLSLLGIELEDKRYSLALHYRLAPDMLAAQRCIDDMLAGEQAGLHLFQGKCVMNIAPDDAADKADAVMSLVGRAGAESALFAGDDVNDEPVFERVPADWLTLKVGRDGPPSSARFVIDTHEEIGSLLQELLQMAKGTAGRPSQSS